VAARPASARLGGDGDQTAWRLPLVVLIAGMFMSILDLSITGYSLAEGVVVPVSAWQRRFDLLGFVTVAGGLFTLLLALSKGEDW
jgi:hypothetical protein